MQRIKKYDGTLGWWFDLLGNLSYTLAKTKDKDLRQDLRAIAGAAIAAKNLWDHTATEREFEALKTTVQEMISAKKHGTKLTLITDDSQPTRGDSSSTQTASKSK